ncbi:acVLRF1 family peptidyl-tRNA hydrolase [Nocardioides psychrotolerans]|uniref:acVLRF1 family peptidyl-tRNA hydrolase n=1 Tax=Nocardioides psychrotolerans TaxID=1005945 RepID=UPI0031381E68
MPIIVPAARIERWFSNFADRHGPTSHTVADGALRGVAEDGSDFVANLPFDQSYDGLPDVGAFVAAVEGSVPDDWGVLLVRKGGFAVARLSGTTTGESKVGQRHVQGRTKAGGQSQQRFARRRDNQARQAYEAAAEHAARILGQRHPVVTGGDRGAVEEVLADARLTGLTVVEPWLDVPDPKRGILEQAVRDACGARIDVRNA